MALTEFEIIERYFTHGFPASSDVLQGIGDDCAVLSVSADQQLHVSVDSSLVGTHFPANASAYDIAWRALAVALSDLAAMGAKARWFTLALSLEREQLHGDADDWLENFSAGLRDLAQRYHVSLVGGDTTRGPLSISIQVMGLSSQGRWLKRSGAQVGDVICVSGPLGNAAAGLALYQQAPEGLGASETSLPLRSEQRYSVAQLLQAYLRPEPRLELGEKLLPYASSCIDISDGLLADLGHILKASSCAACLELTALPLTPALLAVAGPEQAQRWALSGGDDYELCFTVPASRYKSLAETLAQTDSSVIRIGEVIAASTQQPRVQLIDAQGQTIHVDTQGYQHFA